MVRLNFCDAPTSCVLDFFSAALAEISTRWLLMFEAVDRACMFGRLALEMAVDDGVIGIAEGVTELSA